MKVGLIFPNKDRKDKTIHVGLGYLASYARLEHPEIEFSLLDTRVATKKETKKFYQTDFDLIGITVLSPVYYEVIEVFNFIRTNKPDTPICLGGPYVTTIMEEVFEDTPADFAVYGEGEITFSQLLSHLKGKMPIEEIEGIMYQKDGAIVTNPPRDQIEDLDSIPYPAYDLFKMDRYPMHRLVSSRGCPYKCVFCNSSSIWLGKWRKRDPEKVVDEIEYLIKNYKKKTVFFNDNSFNVDLKRVETFCHTILERNLKILWSTPVRVEIITSEIAQLMKKSGCYNVGIGIESANNSILENMQKKNSIEAIQKGIRIFKDAGIEVLGQFVIGSPGDTYETVKESIEFAKNSELDFVMFYSILPFKGTAQWDYVLKHGTLYNEKIHEYHSIKPRIVFETPEFPYADRLKAINLAKKEGYYSDSNDRNLFFDIGKDLATKIQQILPHSIAEKLYIAMKNIYRRRLRKS
ncbi:MAG TPA: radical SAM protein [Bacteroidales bacterium]|nr:radical SAM protein [Bacteroidales bacterium]